MDPEKPIAPFRLAYFAPEHIAGLPDAVVARMVGVKSVDRRPFIVARTLNDRTGINTERWIAAGSIRYTFEWDSTGSSCRVTYGAARWP